MKRQDYTEETISIEADLEEEKVRIRYEWGDNGEGVVNMPFESVYVPCEVCGENTALEDAIIDNNYRKDEIKEFGQRVGRNPNQQVYTKFEIPFYCCKEHAIVGEL